jgi:hypothetical protein
MCCKTYVTGNHVAVLNLRVSSKCASRNIKVTFLDVEAKSFSGNAIPIQIEILFNNYKIFLSLKVIIRNSVWQQFEIS